MFFSTAAFVLLTEYLLYVHIYKYIQSDYVPRKDLDEYLLRIIKSNSYGQQLEDMFEGIHEKFPLSRSKRDIRILLVLQNCDSLLNTGIKGVKGDRGYNGKDGIKGDRGSPGPKGERGRKGAPGIPGAKGETGQKGELGERGTVGDSGARGERGHVGPAGTKGDKGARGESGFKSVDGTPGQKGEIGEKGNTGDAGIKGDKGDEGPPGAKGDQGLAGIKSETGSPGIIGSTGKKGEQGEKCPAANRDGCKLYTINDGRYSRDYDLIRNDDFNRTFKLDFIILGKPIAYIKLKTSNSTKGLETYHISLDSERADIYLFTYSTSFHKSLVQNNHKKSKSESVIRSYFLEVWGDESIRVKLDGQEILLWEGTYGWNLSKLSFGSFDDILIIYGCKENSLRESV